MLTKKKTAVDVNRNPLAFEELAVSLASLASYIDSEKRYLGMCEPIDTFERLYSRALSEPPSYSDITELTGQSLSASDRRASRAAWLLKKVANVAICGVHVQLWHRRANRHTDRYSVPLLDQLGRMLQMERALNDEDLQTRGAQRNYTGVKPSLLDWVGTKDGAIYIGQALHDQTGLNSDERLSQKNTQGVFSFKETVFAKVVLKGKALFTIYDAYDLIRRAFPGVKVIPMVLVLDPELPHFELYRIEVNGERGETVVLGPDLIVVNSLRYRAELESNREWLWVLSERLGNDLFKGLPPCRGSRMLNTLASFCSRQLESGELLACKEKEVCDMLLEDYDLVVPRDKLRHDLVDRLVGQGFMRKWGSEYSVTVKGMARYQYCLAKYTTMATNLPDSVLDICCSHRNKIVGKYGCV